MIPSFPTPWLLLALENSKQAAQLPVEKQLNNLALAGEAWKSPGRGVARVGNWDLPAEASGEGSVHPLGTRGQPYSIPARVLRQVWQGWGWQGSLQPAHLGDKE